MKKLNHWTKGLAVAGMICLAPVAQAQEAAANAVQTKLATTTMSGYVSTSYRWDPGSKDGTTAYSKASSPDRFSLDVVDLMFRSPIGAGDWAAGYTVEIWAGPLANTRKVNDSGTDTGNFALEQANIDLHVPVGSGLDVKIGHFNTIVGYESDHHSTNPHFSQSWGLTIEPTHHTGLMSSYKVNDSLQVGLGIANTAFGSAMNAVPRNKEAKTLLATLNYTLPDNLSVLSGRTLNFGYIDGRGQSLNSATGQPGNTEVDKQHFYAGIKDIPVTEKLTLGLAYDLDKVDGASNDNWSIHTYLSYQINDKTSVNFRYGFVEAPHITTDGGFEGHSFTVTLNHDIWDGVVSRLEYRHDEGSDGVAAAQKSSDIVFMNLVYLF